MALLFFMYMSQIAGYAMRVLGASAEASGILSGIFVIAAVFGRLATGPLITAIGRRKALWVSLVLLLLAQAGYLITGTYAGAGATRTLQGFAMGIAMTVLGAVTLGVAPQQRAGEASGWFGAGLAVSTGVGPLAGAWLVAHGGYRAIFVVGLVIAIVLFPLTWGALKGIPVRRRGGRWMRPPLSLATFVAPRAFPIAAVAMLPALGFAAALTYISDYASTIGLEKAGSLYFLAYAAVIIVARPLAGIAQDRWGNDPVIIPLLVCAIAGLLVTAWAPHATVLVLGGALLGLGYGTLISAGQAVAIKLVGPLNVGLAVGSFYVLVDSGTGLGPMVLSAAASTWGYRVMFVIAAIMAAGGLVLYIARVSDRARGSRA